tara:strand:+ start:1047 stop:1370 length:324 start_codon:yes stop_codon:yes gene_type:complete
MYKNIFIYGLYLSYLLFFIAFTGVFTISPQYLTTLETIIKYYICAFILLRFNPWVSKNIHNTAKNAEFDRRVTFSAGVFLLFSTAFTEIAEYYLVNIKNNITNQINS